MYVLQGHRTVRSRNTYSYDTNTVLHRGNIIPHETHFFSFLNSPRFFYPVGAVHCRPRLSVAARPTLCGYSIGQCRWVSSVIVIIIALVDKGIYSIIWDPDRCLVASRLEKSKTCCLSPAVDMLFSEISSKKVPYSPTAKKKKDYYYYTTYYRGQTRSHTEPWFEMEWNSFLTNLKREKKRKKAPNATSN